MANSRRVIVQDEQTSCFCSTYEKRSFSESKNKYFQKITIPKEICKNIWQSTILINKVFPVLMKKKNIAIIMIMILMIMIKMGGRRPDRASRQTGNKLCICLFFSNPFWHPQILKKKLPRKKQRKLKLGVFGNWGGVIGSLMMYLFWGIVYLIFEIACLVPFIIKPKQNMPLSRVSQPAAA